MLPCRDNVKVRLLLGDASGDHIYLEREGGCIPAQDQQRREVEKGVEDRDQASLPSVHSPGIKGARAVIGSRKDWMVVRSLPLGFR